MMLKILYCYSDKIFVFKEDGIQPKDTRNEVFYNDRRYKLSHEEVNVAPDYYSYYVPLLYCEMSFTTGLLFKLFSTSLLKILTCFALSLVLTACSISLSSLHEFNINTSLKNVIT